MTGHVDIELRRFVTVRLSDAEVLTAKMTAKLTDRGTQSRTLADFAVSVSSWATVGGQWRMSETRSSKPSAGRC